MAQPAKYLFDRNLDTAAVRAEPLKVTLERELRRGFEEELARERRSEYERGRQDGERAARESIEAATGAAVEQLVASADGILSRLAEESAAIRADAFKVAVAASEVLAGELIRRQPTALLESLFSQCLEHLGDAPHVALRVNDALADSLQAKVATIAEQRGFKGRIIVLGDPETRCGDCRIEWADGGIVRDFERLRLSVADIVNRHLHADRPASQASRADTPPNGAATPPARPVSRSNGAAAPSPQSRPLRAQAAGGHR